jgi:hypothetical protein
MNATTFERGVKKGYAPKISPRPQTKQLTGTKKENQMVILKNKE